MAPRHHCRVEIGGTYTSGSTTNVWKVHNFNIIERWVDVERVSNGVDDRKLWDAGTVYRWHYDIDANFFVPVTI